jgi:peptide/nickel transport system permease protein
MAAFLVRKLAGHVVLVALATSLAYVLAAACLRPRADFEARYPRPPQRVVDAELTRLGLNDSTPLAARYAAWAAGVARGDFGRTVDGGSVGAELRRRLGVSLRLLSAGALAGTVLGVALGAYGALRRYRLGDRLGTAVSCCVLAVPVFVLAMLLQLGAQWVNTVAGLHVFEYVGEYTPGGTGGGVLAGLAVIGDRARHLVLPTVTIVLGQATLLSRYQRTVLLDGLHADHVSAAVARGVRRRTAVVKYALRPSLVPVGTYAAYQAGLLLTGAIFTEKIFGWHGMGEWLVDSIARDDVNAVAAIGCCAALLTVTARLLADVLAVILDPRAAIHAYAG